MGSRQEFARALFAEAAEFERQAKDLRAQGRHTEAFQLELNAHNARFDAEHDILGYGEEPYDDEDEQ